RCGGDGGIAHDAFTGRTSGDAANEEPVFRLSVLRITGSVFLIGDLDPIGNGTAEDFEFGAAAKLVETGLRAARSDTKICGGLGTATRLNGQELGLPEKLGAALPEFRLHQIAAIHPSGETGSGADFYVVVTASEDFDPVAIEKHTKLFAHLSDATPECDAAFADIGGAE